MQQEGNIFACKSTKDCRRTSYIFCIFQKWTTTPVPIRENLKYVSGILKEHEVWLH